MSDPILSPTFLFRFSVECRKHPKPAALRDAALSDHHVLPCFGELEGRRLFADVRGAWSEQGLMFTCRVQGKSQAPWCRASRSEDSDGLQLFVDTRNSHNIHRANRFCHRFVFLPTGSGRRLSDPTAEMLLIARAKEPPKPVSSKQLEVSSQKLAGGYQLQAFIPSAAMTGFDPAEHPQLGFSYAVMDRELGWQTFSVGPEFPFLDDPSLWGTLICKE